MICWNFLQLTVALGGLKLKFAVAITQNAPQMHYFQRKIHFGGIDTYLPIQTLVTWPSAGVRSIAITMIVCLSVCLFVCLSVCSHISKSARPIPITFSIRILPATAPLSSDVNAISYVLPVL